jgi:hypothetical protein
MADPTSTLQLAAARRQLSHSSDRLAAQVLAIDHNRAQCLRLADHCEDFAGSAAIDYPSLAAPASRLATLYRELEAALKGLSGATEELTGAAGRVADALATGPLL